MPTKEQAQELVDNCDWVETTSNGVRGFRVTGKNGNSIFLAAGSAFVERAGGKHRCMQKS
jgi:hypothetical protein